MNRGKTIVDGLKCFLWATFFYAFYSAILDIVLSQIQYDNNPRYSIFKSFLSYGTYFIIVCFPIAIPVSIFYNWVVVNGFENLSGKHIIRIFFGLFTGLMIGLSLGRSGMSFYIGNFRPMKNCILFSLVGLSVELIRIATTKYTEYKKLKKEAILSAKN